MNSDINYAFDERQGTQQTNPVANGRGISANGEQFTDDIQLYGGPVDRAEGQLVYHNANRVIGLALHAVMNDGTGRCQVTGIAVTGLAVPAPS